jgi:hypothetical protein
MPKIAYIEKTFQKKTLAIIEAVNAIIDDYTEQGYDLTLRQIYYQLVSKNVIPNSEASYTNLGNALNEARMAGLVDWSSMVDRTRNLEAQPHWNDPADILRAVASSYRLDLWEGQPFYVEVWIEKESLVEIAKKAAHSLDVPCLACRGYMSASEMWVAAQRIINNKGRDAVILHLGDFDPSGIDMTRDIEDRLYKFKADVEVVRIGLNMEQIEQYKLPPNPAKVTDTRAEAYIKQWGRSSWELDALRLEVIHKLIIENILVYMDVDEYKRQLDRQEQERISLEQLIVNYGDIAAK